MAAGVSPLCHFGLPSLWMESEYEFWGCWSFSCRRRLCDGSKQRNDEIEIPYIYGNIIRNHEADSLSYLSWVGISCGLDGQDQGVRLGHGVVTVGTQQVVGLQKRQCVGTLSALGNVLW